MERLIEWVDSSSEEKQFKCLVCGDYKKPKVLEFDINSRTLDFKRHVYRCKECNTLLYDDPKIDITIYPSEEEYSKIKTEDIDSIYIEIDAGISCFAQIINRIAKNYKKASYLDIGCSYGFSLDYCKRALNWDVCGVEPSIYGVWGKRDLGLNIYTGFSHEIDEIKGKKFDVVLSSEVIEHVDEPAKFIEHAKSFLTKDGCLILTTPNEEAIDRNTDDITIHNLMFPGNHYFVTNAVSLKKMLLENGFKYANVYSNGNGLIAYASMKKLAFCYENYSDYKDTYLNYLSERINSSEKMPDYLFRGLASRALEDYTNLNILNKAEEVLKIIYNKLDIEKLIIDFKSYSGKSMKIRFSLPIILYYEGMLNLNLYINYSRAEYLFGECIALIEQLIRQGFYNSSEVYKLYLLKDISEYHYLLSKVFRLVSKPESNKIYTLFMKLPNSKKQFLITQFLQIIPKDLLQTSSLKFRVRKFIFSLLKKTNSILPISLRMKILSNRFVNKYLTRLKNHLEN